MSSQNAPLAYLLLQASRWFDRALLQHLEALGWSLTAAQSLVFAQLDPDGTRLAELARRLGTSRQAAHELVGGLRRLGVLELVPDPDDRRGRLVVLTEDGRRLAAAAREQLDLLERQLAAEVGSEQVEAVRAALSRAWT